MSKTNQRAKTIAAYEREYRKLTPKKGETQCKRRKTLRALLYYYRNPKVRQAYLSRMANPKKGLLRKAKKK